MNKNTDRFGFKTQPSLFQKSKEKRKKIEEDIKRFTQSSSNWSKQSVQSVLQVHRQIPKLDLPISDEPSSKIQLPQQQPQQISEDNASYKEETQEKHVHFEPNTIEQNPVIYNDSNNVSKPIDYSLSLKLSESGVGGVGKKSNRDERDKYVLDEQFYELKESRMLSEDGGKQTKKFVFGDGVDYSKELEENKQISNKDLIQQQKQTVLVNTYQQQRCDEQIGVAHSVEQSIQSLSQSVAPQINSSKVAVNNSITDSQFRETIKHLGGGIILPSEEHQQNLNHKQNDRKIEQIQYNILEDKAQQNNIQSQHLSTNNNVSTNKPLPSPQNISNNSQLQNNNLDNSSGKFFYTSQFKQYMQNKSNYQQDDPPIQLNETIKSSILDKVFNEEIKSPDFIDYVDLSRLKRNESCNQLSNWFELAYEKKTVEILEDILEILKLVPKLKKFERKREQSKLVIYFSHIKLYQEYRKWKKGRKEAAEKFQQSRQKKILSNCFNDWKVISLDSYYQKQSKVRQYIQIKNRQTRYLIFKGWKMLLFHSKIQREAVKFRLGILFRAWHSISKQRAVETHKAALTFYYVNLMARVMGLWREGIHNLREENEKKYIAKNFNRRRLVRIAWRAWSRFLEEQEELNGQDYVPIQIVVKRKFLKD